MGAGNLVSTDSLKPRAKRAAHVAGERKVLTILMADVVNSTALARQVGAEDWTAIMNQAFEVLCPAIEHAGGTVARLMGDALLAFFGAPLAREDDALRAVTAALDLLRATGEFATEVRAAHHIDFAIRVGVSTGPVVLGDVGSDAFYEYTAMGDAVNLAARLQAAAAPMTALLAEETYRAVHGAVRCADQGRLRLKGFREPVHTYRPLEARPAAKRTSVPLVGRLDELDSIRPPLANLRTGGGGLIVIGGEPGVGKSRLLAEVRRLASIDGFNWLQGHAVSFGQVMSYAPFLELVRGAIGITELDSAQTGWAKLAAWATPLLGAEADDLLPYLGVLLALDGAKPGANRIASDSVGRPIFRAMRRVVHALAHQRPTILALEDVHWLDQSTRELLEHLLPLRDELPFLVIVTARPEETSNVNQLCELARSDPAHSLDLSLGPLPDTDSVRFVAQLLETDALPTGLFPLIHARAEGNPFFMEEIVRALIEQRALTPDTSGVGWPPMQLEHLAIPDTIQGLLQARLDRLEPEVREVVRIASVIGRTFSRRVLSAVAESGDALDAHLAQLEDVDLIRERRRTPEVEYLFKHALTQEAAYDGILVRRRREIHKFVAVAIEALFAQRHEEFCAVLAYHYGHAEEWAKAREYLLRAGDQAGRLAADSEALDHYQQALDVHARISGDRWDPLERAALERNMGRALMRRPEYDAARRCLAIAVRRVGGKYPETGVKLRLTMLAQVARQAVHRLVPWATGRNSGDRVAADARARIYEHAMAVEYLLDLERSAVIALIALNDAEASGAGYGIALGSTGVGLMCDTLGAFDWAAGYHRRALAAAAPLHDPHLLGVVYFASAFHQDYVGNWTLALDEYQRAAELLWRAGELRVWATTRVRASFLTSWRQDFATALQQVEEVIQVTRDSGDGAPRAWAEGLRGYLVAQGGDLEDGIRIQESALELIDRLPDYQGAVAMRGGLAQCYLWRGALAEAEAVIDLARAAMVKHNVRGLNRASLVVAEVEAGLLSATLSSAQGRRAALKRAQRTCHQAIAAGKQATAAQPAAFRGAGTCAFLRGQREEARRLWLRSLEAAEVLQAKFEVARTLLEMGAYLGDRSSVAKAEALARSHGAELVRRRAQEVLEGLSS
jgi:class 3 adenylate cyclase/tetratricopeptide (TPR) repeat protein